ncbi:MAG: ferrous iron transporter B [Ruminococcaceae bacterium]|nr:ferrous iron transporter B [Oscillospiraceae bacterium]
MRIALAGNPNSGKTTMYNALTGQNEKVGNWAGVTVEKKEHSIKKSIYSGAEELIAVDLPGAYSMSPFTSEESITSSYVKNENPDVIINIVDATNLSRSLFFTSQLLELGIPVVVALNKTDINNKKQTEIDENILSSKLGCTVIKTTSTTGEGLKDVISAAVLLAGKIQTSPYIQGDIDLTNRQAVEAADRSRFRFVNGIVSEVEHRKILTKERNSQDKIDNFLTNKWLGIPVFAIVMFLVFQISQAWLGPFIADTFVSWLEMFKAWIGTFFENANPLLSALLVDGVIGGVIAVIGFLPLVMVMYFLIALLEDCGYMARVSVVLDPIFKKVGLSGKSVIPFVIGTGCAIPGVMACRTIRNERERRATAMLAPFMPCGAKLPVIALFAGVFFQDASWVGTLMYFAGIIIIFLGALLVNKITGYKARKSFFIIELPEYKVPSLLRAAKAMCSRGWAYIVKAATIILLCNTAVQIMQTFDWNFAVAETADTSILASIAGPFAYLLIPVVGYYSWQLAAASVTGFIAKENVVGTLAVCFGISNLINIDELVIAEGAATSEIALAFGGGVQMPAIAALAYLMFNLFTPPCFAAIGAMNSEMKSAKWLFGGIALQLGVGFTVGYLVYQIGTLITTGVFGEGFVPGLIAVAVIAGILVYLCINADKKAKEEYRLNISK